MKHLIALFVLVIALIMPVSTEATEVVDFQALKTSDLLDLCTTTPEDDLYQQAINFCHGYLVGAFHYYAASRIGPGYKQEVCFPVPKPTRNEAVGMFVKWAQDNPQYNNEIPVETEFRFLHDTWPCD